MCTFWVHDYFCMLIIHYFILISKIVISENLETNLSCEFDLCILSFRYEITLILILDAYDQRFNNKYVICSVSLKLFSTAECWSNKNFELTREHFSKNII